MTVIYSEGPTVIERETAREIISEGAQGPPGPQGSQGSIGPAGTTNHSALTNLNADDHPQYLNNTRGDARYYLKSYIDNAFLDVSAEIDAAIDNLLAGAPGALDTLNELAAALGDDANFAASVANSLALKANLSGAAFTGAISVDYSNSDYTNSGGAGSHIKMTNPNTFGQNVVSSLIDGNLVAKWRTDYVGNINWVSYANTSARGHYFYVGGDYGTGSAKVKITTAGTVLGSGDVVSETPGYALDVRGTMGVLNSNAASVGLTVKGAASQSASYFEAQASNGVARIKSDPTIPFSIMTRDNGSFGNYASFYGTGSADLVIAAPTGTRVIFPNAVQIDNGIVFQNPSQTINLNYGVLTEVGTIVTSTAAPAATFNLYNDYNAYQGPAAQGYIHRFNNPGYGYSNWAAFQSYDFNDPTDVRFLVSAYGYGFLTNKKADAVVWRLKAASGQTANIQTWEDNSSNVLSAIDKSGAYKPASMADASAPNNSLYYSTTASKLCYKDASGVVSALY